MPLSLMAELAVTPAQTTFVGDSLRDLESGTAAGCRVVLVRTGNGAGTEPRARAAGYTEVYDDLKSFAEAEIGNRTPGSGVQH